MGASIFANRFRVLCSAHVNNVHRRRYCVPTARTIERFSFRFIQRASTFSSCSSVFNNSETLFCWRLFVCFLYSWNYKLIICRNIQKYNSFNLNAEEKGSERPGNRDVLGLNNEISKFSRIEMLHIHATLTAYHRDLVFKKNVYL